MYICIYCLRAYINPQHLIILYLILIIKKNNQIFPLNNFKIIRNYNNKQLILDIGII